VLRAFRRRHPEDSAVGSSAPPGRPLAATRSFSIVNDKFHEFAVLEIEVGIVIEAYIAVLFIVGMVFKH
jgi:hypothetical protein